MIDRTRPDPRVPRTGSPRSRGLRAPRVALPALLLLGLAACGGEPVEPDLRSQVEALDRADARFTVDDRPEFVAAVEERLDELAEVRDSLAESAQEEGAEALDALEARMADLREQLLELELLDGDAWQERRGAVLEELEALKDSTLEHLPDLPS